MKIIVTPREEKETELIILKSILDPKNLQFGFWKKSNDTVFENDENTIYKFKLKLKETCTHSM